MIAYNCEAQLLDQDAPSFMVEVRARGEERWSTNGLRYSTIDGASSAAADLAGRWTALSAWRVVDSQDAPNRD